MFAVFLIVATQDNTCNTYEPHLFNKHFVNVGMQIVIINVHTWTHTERINNKL